MADQNNFCCTGRLGKDPELRYTNSGKAVCSLSVAVSGYNDETLWIRATAWDKTAEIANQYLKKGSRLALSGRLSEREWEKSDGTKGRSTELTVANLTLLDPKSEGQQSGQRDNRPANQQQQRHQQQRQQRPQASQHQQTTMGWRTADDDITVDEIPF